jgi:copper chaperone CopZ
MEWTVLIVEEMMCETSCVPTVVSALKGLVGVRRAELISLASKLIKIQHDQHVTTKQLVSAVEGVGFGAEEIRARKPTIVLNVEGMMCQKNCGSTVANTLRNNGHVLWAIAVFESKEALGTYSLTYSLTHLLTHSPTHSLTYSLKVWTAQPVASALIQQLINSVEAVGFDCSLRDSSQVSVAHSSAEPPCDISIKLSVKTFKNTSNEKITSSIVHLLESADGVMRAAVNPKDSTVSIWGFADYDSVVTILRTNGYVVEDKESLVKTPEKVKSDKYGSLDSSSRYSLTHSLT